MPFSETITISREFGLPLKLYIRYAIGYWPEIVGEEDWPEKHEGCGAGLHS
jgi:hypothetical protein